MRYKRLEAVDVGLLRLARTRGHTRRLDRAVARFTLLGEHAAVWLAIGALGAAVDEQQRARWRRATAAVAGMYGLNTAIKLVVRRSRPRLRRLPPLIATPTTLSFPSAHASTAFAGAVAYSRLGLPALPLYALAAKLSYSRLYLGVHYPSDVLAGALIGAAAGALGTHSAGGRGAGGTASASAQKPSEVAPGNGHAPQAFATRAAGGAA